MSSISYIISSPSPSPFHLSQIKANVTSHPSQAATACINRTTPHHSSFRFVQGRSTHNPSHQSHEPFIRPVPGALLKTATSRASLFLFSFFNTILFHLNFHLFRHLSSNRPSQGPAPRQTLLWLDGFDGLWPTASAHFPRRHNDPFCCFVSTNVSCCVPLFTFPFVSLALCLSGPLTNADSY